MPFDRAGIRRPDDAGRAGQVTLNTALPVALRDVALVVCPIKLDELPQPAIPVIAPARQMRLDAAFRRRLLLVVVISVPERR